MNIIIVSKFFRTPKKLAFDDPKTATVAGIAVFALLAVAFGLGMVSRGINGPAKAEIDRLQVQLDKQTIDLKKANHVISLRILSIMAPIAPPTIKGLYLFKKSQITIIVSCTG